MNNKRKIKKKKVFALPCTLLVRMQISIAIMENIKFSKIKIAGCGCACLQSQLFRR
jgi:hypothetical protein